MIGPFEPSAGPRLGRLRALIAASPIRTEQLAHQPQPRSLSWDEIRHSPELDLLILKWIVSHVPPGLRRHAH